MPKFRKKPVVIEAREVTWEDLPHIAEWCKGWIDADEDREDADQYLLIPTMEGEMRANLGDWIIRGVKGEFYPCKPDIFAATYEPA